MKCTLLATTGQGRKWRFGRLKKIDSTASTLQSIAYPQKQDKPLAVNKAF